MGLRFQIKELHASIDNVPEVLFVAMGPDGALIGRVTLTDHITRSAAISMLYVHEDFRRQGVATALIDECCGLAQQMSAVETIGLIMAKHNLAARNLYQKLGFQFAFVYEDGDYLMIKRLKE